MQAHSGLQLAERKSCEIMCMDKTCTYAKVASSEFKIGKVQAGIDHELMFYELLLSEVLLTSIKMAIFTSYTQHFYVAL